MKHSLETADASEEESTSAPVLVNKQRSKAQDAPTKPRKLPVYGSDDRLLEHEVEDPKLLGFGQSVAALIHPGWLEYVGNGRYREYIAVNPV